MPPILGALSLTKRYHDFTLREISLEIPCGCIVGFFGPIGAGKTTLIKLLASQIPASSGTVRVFGLSYDEREKEIKNRMGYVPQEPSFYHDRSVEFNARFAASFFERWDGGVISMMAVFVPAWLSSSVLWSKKMESYAFLRMLPVTDREIVRVKFGLALAAAFVYWLILSLLVRAAWGSAWEYPAYVALTNLTCAISLPLVACWYIFHWRLGMPAR